MWRLPGFFPGCEDLERTSLSTIHCKKKLSKLEVHGFEPIRCRRQGIFIVRLKTELSQSLLSYRNYPAFHKIMRHIKQQQGTTYCQKAKQSIQPYPGMTQMLKLLDRELKITI